MCEKMVDWCGRPDCSREFELKELRDPCKYRGKPGHNLNVVQVDQPGKNLCRRCVLEDDLVQACTKLEEDLLEKGGLRPLSPVSGYEWSDSESSGSGSGLSSPAVGSEADGGEVEAGGDGGDEGDERVEGAEGGDEGQDGNGGAGNGGGGDNDNASNVPSSPYPRVIVRDIYTSDSDSVWWEGEGQETPEYSESEQSVSAEELDEEEGKEEGEEEAVDEGSNEDAGRGLESARLTKRKREGSDGSVSSSRSSDEEEISPKVKRHCRK